VINYEFGAGIWMFQQFIDRYATDAYGPPVGTLEAIERATAVGDIKVLDINYPFAGEGVTVAQVRETLQRTGLRAQAITPHLYMREFQLGSFTNPDPAVRH
jgi:xylose isomerase